MINLIKKLRLQTGISILECKKALIQSKGNFNLAFNYICRSKNISIYKRSIDNSLYGLVFTKISQDYKFGVIIEFRCETDFVEKNIFFINFCKSVINRASNTYNLSLLNLKKEFKKDQIFLISKIQENIDIYRIKYIKSDIVVSYIHHSKHIGVLVGFNKIINDLNIFDKISMHIASESPLYLNINNIPEEIMYYEYNFQKKNLLKNNFLNKSNDIINKIIFGKLKRFINSVVLMEQKFIFNISCTIKKIILENNFKINNFCRFCIGKV